MNDAAPPPRHHSHPALLPSLEERNRFLQMTERYGRQVRPREVNRDRGYLFFSRSLTTTNTSPFSHASAYAILPDSCAALFSLGRAREHGRTQSKRERAHAPHTARSLACVPSLPIFRQARDGANATSAVAVAPTPTRTTNRPRPRIALVSSRAQREGAHVRARNDE